jgi:hypothetical protein
VFQALPLSRIKTCLCKRSAQLGRVVHVIAFRVPADNRRKSSQISLLAICASAIVAIWTAGAQRDKSCGFTCGSVLRSTPAIVAQLLFAATEGLHAQAAPPAYAVVVIRKVNDADALKPVDLSRVRRPLKLQAVRS